MIVLTHSLDERRRWTCLATAWLDSSDISSSHLESSARTLSSAGSALATLQGRENVADCLPQRFPRNLKTSLSFQLTGRFTMQLGQVWGWSAPRWAAVIQGTRRCPAATNCLRNVSSWSRWEFCYGFDGLWISEFGNLFASGSGHSCLTRCFLLWPRYYPHGWPYWWARVKAEVLL